ncbi:MAG: response regulator transcription factor [Chloroflexi bacterium]|nr:response regulator transcription factor [Chloroflexota bacterium]
MPVQRASVLLADPDPARRRAGLAALRAAGLSAVGAAHQAEAERLSAAHRPALAIVDTTLPPGGGWAAIRALRRVAEVAVVLLSHDRDQASRVAYLAAGADDVLDQPAAPEEVAARARAVLRRLTAAPGLCKTLAHGDLVLEPHGATAWVGDRRVQLTPDQGSLLRLFLEFPGRVFSRAELAARLGSPPGESGRDEAIDGHVRALRRKIEPDPSHPCSLLSVRGFGYVLARAEDASPLARELELLRVALQETPTPLVVVDRARRLVLLNRAAEALAGDAAQALAEQQTCADLFQCRRPDGAALTGRACPGLAALRGADGQELPICLRTSTGQYEVLCTHRALRASGQDFVLMAFRSATQPCSATI